MIKTNWKCGKKVNEDSIGVWTLIDKQSPSGAVPTIDDLVPSKSGSTVTVSGGEVFIKNANYAINGTQPKYWHVQTDTGGSVSISANNGSTLRVDTVYAYILRAGEASENGDAGSIAGFDVATRRPGFQYSLA